MKSSEQLFGLRELRQWSGNAPIQLAVLGDPVAHSASPPMHNAALSACGFSQRYGRLHILPEELS
ncbi:MAG: shikimate dehydrogenase, partial [Proteobacteria bacterium]|nr:shikimate dehydrogenase [Pseudomonadota bacterium]